MESASGVHEVCDRYVAEYAAADPVQATLFGIAGYADRLTDYSPAGHRLRAEVARKALGDMAAIEPGSDSERVAKAVFCERLGRELEVQDAGLRAASLNVIASPAQDIRMVFDLMATETAADWAVIAARMEQVPEALRGVRASLVAAAEDGRISARRQLDKTAEQAETWAGRRGDLGFFTGLITPAREVAGAPVDELERSARAADSAYGEFADFLRNELAPRAPVADAVGERTYRLWSGYFTGADIDPREAYDWGWREFSEIEADLLAVAARIAPGKTPAETAAVLDADPKYWINGAAAFEAWLQRTADAALTALRGTHFDIPTAAGALECRIAPPGGGVGAYYLGPSEDLRRPGRMWWSLEAGKERFSTWREVSVVYHEGVPGHHLHAITVLTADGLNRYQRMLSFVDGHSEGWALYAERLMRELGYLSDDGDLFGMLTEQLLRAARVIVDIGMHLELTIPAGTGFHEGERWTPELGLEFLLTRALTEPARARFEIDRYLGWPGQAPAYKLGERGWLAAREEARSRAGESFSLKEFHTRALRMGGMGMDTLRAQLAASEG
ncbi:MULTISPECIES: DUF885 domain-containing protein [unclassified Nocardia]|uniref:DUF885 domain-containing protein n=1 Tax=unclassified Nocardia TaxID=2637762 RepID=UPI0033ADA1AF